MENNEKQRLQEVLYSIVDAIEKGFIELDDIREEIKNIF